MSPELNQWLEVCLRWAHVFAGIMWVGATYYFTWLDGRFVELEERAAQNPEDRNPEKYVWMVHSGGFYLVEKEKNPRLLTQTLHWFRWEAGITWITGILLFGLLYWHGANLSVMEESAQDRWAHLFPSLGIPGWANGPLTWITDHYIWTSFILLLLGWAVYDVLWSKFLKNNLAGIGLSYALIVVTILFSCIAFGGRGAFVQVGAMLGTIMAANVWMRILPSQRRMVAALKAGQKADLAEGESAKNRSRHNSFIVIPVVFMMISNHYPLICGSRYNWLILSVLVLVGWFAAKIIRKA